MLAIFWPSRCCFNWFRRSLLAIVTRPSPQNNCRDLHNNGYRSCKGVHWDIHNEDSILSICIVRMLTSSTIRPVLRCVNFAEAWKAVSLPTVIDHFDLGAVPKCLHRPPLTRISSTKPRDHSDFFSTVFYFFTCSVLPRGKSESLEIHNHNLDNHGTSSPKKTRKKPFPKRYSPLVVRLRIHGEGIVSIVYSIA